MPELVKSSVGSLAGTSGLEATAAWPRSSKNFRNLARISADFMRTRRQLLEAADFRPIPRFAQRGKASARRPAPQPTRCRIRAAIARAAAKPRRAFAIAGARCGTRRVARGWNRRPDPVLFPPAPQPSLRAWSADDRRRRSARAAPGTHRVRRDPSAWAGRFRPEPDWVDRDSGMAAIPWGRGHSPRAFGPGARSEAAGACAGRRGAVSLLRRFFRRLRSGRAGTASPD